MQKSTCVDSDLSASFSQCLGLIDKLHRFLDVPSILLVTYFCCPCYLGEQMIFIVVLIGSCSNARHGHLKASMQQEHGMVRVVDELAVSGG